MISKQELFKYPSGVQQINNESSEKYELLEIGTDMKGESLLMKIKDGMFPLKNMVFAETLFGANMVKALVILSLNIFSKPLFTLGLLFINKQYLLDQFNRISYRICRDKILKYKHWSKFGKAFYSVINEFLVEIGFTEESSDQFAEMFIFIIDSDNAYRLRIEDIFSCSTKEQFIKNPRKEIKRLLKIFSQRDNNSAAIKKFTNLVSIILYLLYIPKYKRAFIKAVQNSNFTDLQLDEGDSYWSCMRLDYNFMGMTFDERQEYAIIRGYKFPQQDKMKKINEQQIQMILSVLEKANVGIQDYMEVKQMLQLLPNEMPKIPDVIIEPKK
jgi:hypothetical protein